MSWSVGLAVDHACSRRIDRSMGLQRRAHAVFEAFDLVSDFGCGLVGLASDDYSYRAYVSDMLLVSQIGCRAQERAWRGC